MFDAKAAFNPRNAFSGHLSLLLLGATGGIIFNALTRAVEYMQMLNFFTVLMLCQTFLWMAFGAARRRNPKRGPLFYSVFFTLFAVAVFASGLFNKDVSTMAFGALIYYPVPLPKTGTLNVISLFLFIFGTPAMGWPIGAALAETLRRRELGVRGWGWFLTGYGVGYALTYVFATTGPWLWFFIGLTLFLALTVRVGFAVAGVAAMIALGVLFHYRPQHNFFNWGVVDYRYLSGGYGRDIKVDFLEYPHKDCLGVAISNIAMAIDCLAEGWLPSEDDYYVRTMLYPDRFVPRTDTRPDVDKPEHRPPWWRSDLKVLVIGHGSGSVARVLELYSGPNNYDLVQFDPKLSELMYTLYGRYFGEEFPWDRFRALAGDQRTQLNLAEGGEKYDLIYFAGIGTKTYQYPRSYIYAENYLLTDEALRFVFDRLIKPDGVFMIDWGSSDSMEARYLTASIPREVPTAAFWNTASEYPFAGTPLLMIVSTWDREKLENVRKRMHRLSGVYDIDYNKNLDFFRTTDLRPVSQPDLHWLLTIIHTVLLLPAWLLYRRFRDRFERADGDRKRLVGIVLLGTGTGFAETLFSSFNPFILGPSTLPSWMVNHGVFLIALGIGVVARTFARASRRGTVFGLAVAAVGSSCLLLLRGHPWIFAAAPLAGLGFGWIAGGVVSAEGGRVPQTAAAYFMGSFFALNLFEIFFNLGGHPLIAVLAVALIAVAGAKRFRTTAEPIAETP